MLNRLLILLILLITCCKPETYNKTELKVLQFNIWQEGSVVPEGYSAVVDEIVRSEADLIALSEVRNYNDILFSERIVNSLEEKGLKYYMYPSYDTGILSKYPIISFTMLYDIENDHGTISKAIIDINSTEVAFYSGHLDYQNCALYLPRGYHGSTWEKLPEIITDIEKITAVDLASQRDEQVNAFIKDARKEIQKGRLVIYGGDNNEPSFLDWTSATKDLYDHNGLVMPWNNSKELHKNGFNDAYRELYPDPVSHPGFTFPANNEDINLEKLVWSPEADDRDRIDYIFYYPDERIELVNIILIGPSGSIVKNKRLEDDFKDPLVKPLGIWPTDHRALLATFHLTPLHKKTPQ